MSLLFDGALVGFAVAVGVAFKKHGTLKNVMASASKEAANLEALGSKIAADAKPAFDTIVARLKALKP